ncbi:MAG TPA: hypothetical protein VGE16_02810, partial [Albitalea sp.]
MDYVDRLIQRALAVPRAQGSGVFDPFEVLAPWVVQPAADTARRVAPADHVAVAPVVVPKSIPAASPPSGEPVHVVPTEPPAQAMAPAEAALARPAKVEPMREVDPRPVPPVEPQAPTPVGLNRADAFMQALGVPPTVVAAPAASRPAPMAPIDA